MSRTTRQLAGDDAESLVAARLAAAGWQIVGRNIRVGRAEIDILGIDPGPPASLVAVEVRHRSRRDYGLAEETVDHRKRARLWAAACHLADVGRLVNGTVLPRLPLRLDLVAVEPATAPEGPRIRHHRWLGRV